MRMLILAQPKSASTSFMEAVGTVSGLSCGQQVMVADPEEGRDFDGKLLNVLNRCMEVFGRNLVVSSTIRRRQYRAMRHMFPTSDFLLLSRFHSDICEFETFEDAAAVLEYEVHKQHFPPTAKNRAAFRDVPRIVLVRDPEETVESYLRVPDNPANRYLNARIRSDSGFRRQVVDDVRLWRDGWVEDARATGVPVIEQGELLRRPGHYVDQVMEMMGLPVRVADGFELPKMRVYR